jgi:pyruvate/2-oxoglutarate dehydrogenase complex dihydrolipoamide dehydrogenase (E3) component
MRTNVPHIFAIGDIVSHPMLAHKAVQEAHVAAEVTTHPKPMATARFWAAAWSAPMPAT